MFGFKQLPWWASCVSSEIARILTHEGYQVAGGLIDDILMVSKADEGRSKAVERYELAKQILKELGTDANDKGSPPAHQLTFTGLDLDTGILGVAVTEEHRQYTIDRLTHILTEFSIKTRHLRSVGGSLSWLCFVMPEGRPRRDEIFKALRQATGPTVKISSPLRRQLKWWLSTLKARRYSFSRIWSRDAIPPAIMMRTDASGDHGFGICVANLHIFGSWRESLADSIKNDMLFKETLPFVLTTTLLAPLFPDHIIAGCSDNAGMVFRVNAGSSRNPFVQRLLRLLTRQVTVHPTCMIRNS